MHLVECTTVSVMKAVCFEILDCKYIRIVHAKEAECSTELSFVIKRLDLSLYQAYHN